MIWESHTRLQGAQSVQFTTSQFCYSLSKRLGALTLSQARLPRGCTSVGQKRDIEKVPGATGQSLAPRPLTPPLLWMDPHVQGGAEGKAGVRTTPVSPRVTSEGTLRREHNGGGACLLRPRGMSRYACVYRNRTRVLAHTVGCGPRHLHGGRHESETPPGQGFGWQRAESAASCRWKGPKSSGERRTRGLGSPCTHHDPREDPEGPSARTLHGAGQ